MSKLSFRARALDATKPLPVFRCEDLPDLHEYASINRAVPQMPTGMEKEEESEHHLQRAISAQQVYGEKRDSMVIPVPEAESNIPYYESLYPGDFKMPKQLIHIQPFSLDAEQPDYDLDSEDEACMLQLQKQMEIGAMQFEEMIERLEKGSGQQLVTLQEAKLLLKEDDVLIQEVYEYWSRKRRSCSSGSLIPTVKQEKRDGSSTNDPYVAFRRRTEKMQTRKNRKNDEASYEKMLKLRRDLSRAVSILEMIKRRERSKRELLSLTLEIVEKRNGTPDFGADVMAEALAQRALVKPVYSLPLLPIPSSGQLRHHDHLELKDYRSKPEKTEVVRTKRKYEKKQKPPALSASQHSGPAIFNPKDLNQYDFPSSDDEPYTQIHSGSSEAEEENDPDGVYAFRRKAGCVYHAARSESGSWPWTVPEEGGSADPRFRFSLTSLNKPLRCLGLARRRLGRGGRILLDRASSDLDSVFHRLDSMSEPDLSPLHSASTSDAPTHTDMDTHPADRRGDPAAADTNTDTHTHTTTTTTTSSSQSRSLAHELRQVLLNIRTSRWRHFRPRTHTASQSAAAAARRPLRGIGRAGAGAAQGRITPLIMVTAEQFQQHQEHLALMQKEQLEQQASQTVTPTQIVQMLDSAGAQFAASALMTADQLLTLKVKEEGSGGGGVNGVLQPSGVYKGLLLPTNASSPSTTTVSSSMTPSSASSTPNSNSAHAPNAHLALGNHGNPTNSAPPVLIGNNLRLSMPAPPISGLSARHLPRSLSVSPATLKLNNNCQIPKVATTTSNMDLVPRENHEQEKSLNSLSETTVAMEVT
ncbi:enhancer of polycomb homolog 1 isoform X1 [Alosa sapidissima]|uniref:enhancer of polycomb homolog 1 isoform X1 n=2 Tax=Alosa sapidissima TaxID=34773 RepID=UPI001C07F8AE|nr:enhancer of polycomb homolog 1 isoform X1 [Alosa sapidissima]